MGGAERRRHSREGGRAPPGLGGGEGGIDNVPVQSRVEEGGGGGALARGERRAATEPRAAAPAAPAGATWGASSPVRCPPPRSPAPEIGRGGVALPFPSPFPLQQSRGLPPFRIRI